MNTLKKNPLNHKKLVLEVWGHFSSNCFHFILSSMKFKFNFFPVTYSLMKLFVESMPKTQWWD